MIRRLFFRVPGSMAVACLCMLCDPPMAHAEPVSSPSTAPRLVDSPYNLEIDVSEALINRAIAHERIEHTPVRDMILGANVFGEQWTRTRFCVDLKPETRAARIVFRVSGATESRTVGLTPSAAVNTLGCHRFLVERDVFFDAHRFMVGRSRASAWPRNITRGVSTPWSGLPLIGPMVNQYAYSATEQQRPLAEMIAAHRLLDSVVPQTNRSVDAELVKWNRRLESELRPQSKSAGLLPASESITTTEHCLHYRALLGSTSRVPAPKRVLGAGRSVTLWIHESAFSHVLSRMAIEKKSVSVKELTRIDLQLRQLLPTTGPAGGREQGEPVEAENADPFATTTLVFTDRDPIRVEIAGGRMTWTVCAAIQLPLVKPTPMQRITIPLELKLDGDWLRIEAGNVDVAPNEPPAAPGGAGLMLPVIRQQIQSRLKPLNVKRRVVVPLSANRDLSVFLRELSAADGWLALAFD